MARFPAARPRTGAREKSRRQSADSTGFPRHSKQHWDKNHAIAPPSPPSHDPRLHSPRRLFRPGTPAAGRRRHHVGPRPALQGRRRVARRQGPSRRGDPEDQKLREPPGGERHGPARGHGFHLRAAQGARPDGGLHIPQARRGHAGLGSPRTQPGGRSARHGVLPGHQLRKPGVARGRGGQAPLISGCRSRPRPLSISHHGSAARRAATPSVPRPKACSRPPA